MVISFKRISNDNCFQRSSGVIKQKTEIYVEKKLKKILLTDYVVLVPPPFLMFYLRIGFNQSTSNETTTAGCVEYRL